MIIYIEVGKKIKEARKKAGYTQEILANSAGISPHFLSCIENGKEKASLETIHKISSGLGIPVYRLFQFDKEINKTQKHGSHFDALLKNFSKKDLDLIMDVIEDTSSWIKKRGK